MRLLLKLSSVAALLCALTTPLSAAGTLFSTTIDGTSQPREWFANSPVTGGTGSLALDPSTGALNLTSNLGNNYAALTYIAPVSLVDGQTFTVSITALLLDTPAQTAGGAKFTFGLLDTPSANKLTDNAPSSEYTSAGGYAFRGRTFSQGARNYFASAGGSRSFVASLETNSGNQSPSVKGLSTSTPLTLTFNITREGGAITLSSTDGTASQTFPAANFSTPSQFFTFNTLFIGATSGVGVAIQSVEIVTGVVPGTPFPATIDGEAGSLNWFANSPATAGTGSLAIDAGTGNLNLTSEAGNSYSAVSYIEPIDLQNGQSITLSITGKLLGTPAQTAGGAKINLGLLNTPDANRLADDAPNSEYTSAGGYAVRGRTLTSGSRNYFKTDGGARSYAASLETNSGNFFPGLAPFVTDSSTTYSLTISKSADQIILTSTDGVAERTFPAADFAGTTAFSSFNTLFIGANSGVGLAIESIAVTRNVGPKIDDFGLIDVTAAPYNADPTGASDSTEAFRAAIAAAYSNDIESNKAVYVPAGNYVISDTIELKQPGEANRGTLRPSNMLLGSVNRPVIRLVNNATGFADRESPKAMFYLWRESYRPGEEGVEKANDHFNTLFRNLILDTGSGNAGAVGVRFRGAEGTALTDVKVFSSSASPYFAGVWDLLGSGGSVTNLEVIGGRYGIWAPVAQPNPVVTGVRLIGQTDLAIAYRQWTPLTVIGFEIQKEHGPVIGGTDTLELSKPPLNKPDLATNETSANVAFIDGSIAITSGTDGAHPQTAVLHADRNIYLENVYMKGVAKAAENIGVGADYDLASATPWTRILRYAGGPDFPDERPRMIDGVKTAAEIKSDEPALALPAQSFIAKHTWTQGFATHDRANVLNVKTAPYNAKADGLADDTAAIQAAIDAAAGGSGLVFLPKGTYRLTAPLLLAANTELFGVGKNISILDGQGIPQQSGPSAMIVSPNDANATCSVSGVQLLMPVSSREVGAVWWRAGAHTFLRDLWAFNLSGGSNGPLKRLRFSDNGGGHVYNWHCNYPTGSVDTGYRNVFIDGTHAPLFFYQLHNQHIIPSNGARIEAVNASNITIFGTKNESETSGSIDPSENLPLPLLFDNCQNVRIYGYCGLSTTRVGQGLINFKGSSDYRVANSGTWRASDSASIDYVQERDSAGNLLAALHVTIDATASGVPSNFISLVQRGSPFDPTSIVTLSVSTANLEVGESLQLSATVTPAAGNPSGVSWHSSDQAVASVDGTGLVTAVGPGSVTVTATSLDSGFSASTEIEVVTPPTSYEVWSIYRGLDPASNAGPNEDPNHDATTNAEHFAFDTDPLGSAATEGKVVSALADLDGQTYFTITFPVRLGAVFHGSPLVSEPIDGVIYKVSGDDNLSGADVEVVERPALSDNLPALGNYDPLPGPDWEYRSFRLASPTTALARGFITVAATPALETVE